MTLHALAIGILIAAGKVAAIWLLLGALFFPMVIGLCRTAGRDSRREEEDEARRSWGHE